MKLIENYPIVFSEDILYDVFYHSNLYPDKFIENPEDVKKIEEAINIVLKYVYLLEDIVEEA